MPYPTGIRSTDLSRKWNRIEGNMETINGVPTIFAPSREDWRGWLAGHCQSEKQVWLILYKKKSSTPSVSFHDAILDALCFGWVDSKAIPRDAESFCLLFSHRNPKSTWGKINRERAEELIRQGLMMPPGQGVIDLAKQSGTWSALSDAQNLVIPDDLQQLFDLNATAYQNFQSFSPASKRVILEWICNAKKAETRERRIAQTVELAERNQKANHPRP